MLCERCNLHFCSIFVCINSEENNVAIFDGGSTISSLYMIYNFKSKEFADKFIQICKKYRLSKNGNVLSLQCQKQDFATRLEDFISALNDICNI